jgi:hypothetical protein
MWKSLAWRNAVVPQFEGCKRSLRNRWFDQGDEKAQLCYLEAKIVKKGTVCNLLTNGMIIKDCTVVFKSDANS